MWGLLLSLRLVGGGRGLVWHILEYYLVRVINSKRIGHNCNIRFNIYDMCTNILVQTRLVTTHIIYKWHVCVVSYILEKKASRP